MFSAGMLPRHGGAHGVHMAAEAGRGKAWAYGDVEDAAACEIQVHELCIAAARDLPFGYQQGLAHLWKGEVRRQLAERRDEIVSDVVARMEQGELHVMGSSQIVLVEERMHDAV